MSEQSKFTATLKAGQSFDAPWIVVYFDTAAEGLALLTTVAETGLDLAVANAAKELQAKYAVASGGMAPQQVATAPVAAPQAAPAPAHQPPAPVAQAPAQGEYIQGSKYPPCQHGAYIWKDFTSKAGKPIKGWFCPGQGRTECPADFRN